MRATRIRRPRRTKPVQWNNTAAAAETSSSATNGGFADRSKTLHARLREQGQNGAIIRLASVPSPAVLEDLFRSLAAVTVSAHPRTFKLLQSGRRKLARKVIEEACEVTVEAVKRDIDGVVRESADLLYHIVVLWFQMGIEPAVVWEEMQSRADTLGIAEKLPKLSPDNDPFAASGR